MAVFKTLDGRTFECDTNTFVGRGVLNGISFERTDGFDPEVSSIHAAITWSANAHKWEVRDLGSQNGTFVDGKKVEPGKRVRIFAGACIVFGRLEVTMIDDAPPTAHAVCASSGEVRFCRNGVLLLPDDTAPELAIVRRDQGWCALPASDLARGGEDHAVGLRQLDPISEELIGGRNWQIRVPAERGHTLSRTRRLSDYEVVIEVRGASDRINLRLEHEEGVVDLPRRAHCEMLWVLALRRREDIDNGLEVDKQGWMTKDDVIRQVRAGARDPLSHLNIQVMRARRQVQPHAPEDYMAFVENHPTRDAVVRIGTDRLRIDDYTGE